MSRSRPHRPLRVGTFVLLSGVLLFADRVSGDESDSESLDPKQFQNITFKNISPTHYEVSGDSLLMVVKESAAALVRPFPAVRKIWRIRFQWKLEGILKTQSAAYEQTKAGDDVPLRIGLLLAGSAPMVPIFAPDWIKAVRDIMKLSSDRMIYFVAGSQSSPGTIWSSPYSSSIETRSLGGSKGMDGWEGVDQKLETFDVVGLWLMADGDNTGSNFTVKLRGLRFN